MKHMDANEIWMLWRGGLLQTFLLVIRQVCINRVGDVSLCTEDLLWFRMLLALLRTLFLAELCSLASLLRALVPRAEASF